MPGYSSAGGYLGKQSRSNCCPLAGLCRALSGFALLNTYSKQVLYGLVALAREIYDHNFETIWDPLTCAETAEDAIIQHVAGVTNDRALSARICHTAAAFLLVYLHCSCNSCLTTGQIHCNTAACGRRGENLTPSPELQSGPQGTWLSSRPNSLSLSSAMTLGSTAIVATKDRLHFLFASSVRLQGSFRPLEAQLHRFAISIHFSHHQPGQYQTASPCPLDCSTRRWPRMTRSVILGLLILGVLFRMTRMASSTTAIYCCWFCGLQ